tara:strand:- start:2627 stop:2830 length:204 start_codon:yes stop_codon:yes gene_type:complete
MDQLRALKMFSVMQDIITQDKKTNIKKWIKNKEKLIFATHGIIKPENWDQLSDKEKEKRIKKTLKNI